MSYKHRQSIYWHLLIANWNGVVLYCVCNQVAKEEHVQWGAKQRRRMVSKTKKPNIKPDDEKSMDDCKVPNIDENPVPIIDRLANIDPVPTIQRVPNIDEDPVPHIGRVANINRHFHVFF